MKKTHDADDLAGWASCDANALERLYERYFDRIFGYCVRRLFVKEVAEDVTSTIFLRVAEHFDGFRGTREKDIRNWLYTITTNEVNSHIRSTKQRQRLFEAACGHHLRGVPVSSGADRDRRPVSSDAGHSLRLITQPERHHALDWLDWPVLYRAILELSPKHQTVIVLRFFEGLGHEDIAEILNCQRITARVTLKRALDKLRKRLRPMVT